MTTKKDTRDRLQKKLSNTEKQQSIWLFPELSRADRIDLLERLKVGSDWDFDFALLTVLSTAIAAFGLINGSTGIVIGAMLVAPWRIRLLARPVKPLGSFSIRRGMFTLFFGGRTVNDRGKTQIHIFLSANRAIENNFREIMIGKLQTFLGREVEISIHMFQEVSGSEATHFEVGADGSSKAK